MVASLSAIGIRRVRLTGGEPTLRRDIVEVAAAVASIPGVEEVALTTNGQQLDRLAARLRAAGVSRLNVSLDSLDATRLRRISGPAASLSRILAGLKTAAAVGFASLKLNVVVLRGENDSELGDLARQAWRLSAIPRFIELMPFGPGARVRIEDIRRLLEVQGVALVPENWRDWGPATYMRGASEGIEGRLEGRIGFIGPMSECFCATCNRIRIAADGSLRTCLARPDRVDLGGLAASGDVLGIQRAVREALTRKPERHQLGNGSPASMRALGG